MHFSLLRLRSSSTPSSTKNCESKASHDSRSTRPPTLKLEAPSFGRLSSCVGALIGLGVLYIVMGMFVKQYPVPLTIAALVLYIGSAAVFAILDPATLASGIIVKILIIVGLAKAVQAALAYERERKALIAAEFGG